MAQVKKAIIPAAGLGTRFLPATKALPKEMLPIVDKPTIQYIVEEAIESGIEDILIITGRTKRAIEDHFDRSVEIEQELTSKNKSELLDLVRELSNLADIHYIRQKAPLGLGHAIFCARTFIGSEPFAVLLGDDIVRSETPAIKQLIQAYDQTRTSVVGVRRVDIKDTNKYGIIAPADAAPGAQADARGRLMRVRDLVEKPQKNPPSDYAIMGRYVITPDIFDVLERQQPGAGGEIQLTDGLKSLLDFQDIYAYEFEGDRFDVGDKIGFLRATMEFALCRGDLEQEMRVQIAEVCRQYNINI